MLQALVATRIDAFAGVGLPALYTISQKAPDAFSIFMTHSSIATDASNYLLVRNDSSFRVPADLKGKTIGTYPGTTLLAYARIIFSRYLDPDNDLIIEQISPTIQMEALVSGRVDALFTLDPIATMIMQKGLATPLVVAPMNQYIMEPMPGTSFGVSMDLATNRPHTSGKIRLVLEYATNLVAANPLAAKDSIVNCTKLDRALIDAMPTPKYQKLEGLPLEDLQKLSDILLEAAVLVKPVMVESLIYKAPAQQVPQ